MRLKILKPRTGNFDTEFLLLQGTASVVRKGTKRSICIYFWRQALREQARTAQQTVSVAFATGHFPSEVFLGSDLRAPKPNVLIF